MTLNGLTDRLDSRLIDIVMLNERHAARLLTPRLACYASVTSASYNLYESQLGDLHPRAR